MKLFIYSLLIFLCLSTQIVQAQEQIKIDENTIIKNDEGNEITLQQFMILMRTGDWTIKPKTDSTGKQYLQMVKTTAEEKAEMLEMMADSNKLNENVGKEAPDFLFTDLNGNIISKANTKGKVVVLNFWFTTCPPCIQEIPELNEVYNTFKSNEDVVFASISFEDPNKVERFLKKKPINYPVVAYARKEISKFNVSGYPTNTVIGKDGKFTEFIVGGFPGVGESISESIKQALKK
ncbi:TlpA family protein disulfide reductase [Winogradskyella litorisediminis]|uniref:TlpA family protein disulfide reductase n=1 Tax=Winogradskyella litorisediminis TaxID=1156618 RepID=A0ABW3N6R3_9FLAO